MEETEVPATITAMDTVEMPPIEAGETDSTVVHQIVMCPPNAVGGDDDVIVDGVEIVQSEQVAADSIVDAANAALSESADQEALAAAEQNNEDHDSPTFKHEIEPLLQLPNGYSYLRSDRKMRCDDSWKVHIRIQEVDELCTWLKTYQEISGSTWRVLKTYPRDGKRYSHKVDYRCQHNTLPRSSTANTRRRSKNCECPAKLSLSLRRVDNPSSIKWVDRHLKEGYLASCTFGRTHNHPLICADTLRFRDVSEVTQLKLRKLFEAGHSPTSACEFIKSELFDSCGPDEFLVKSADRSVCPDLSYCFRLYNKMFRKAKPSLKANVKETSTDKLKSNVRQYNQELGRESVKLGILNDKVIAAVCTPLMQRVNDLWPCSADLVYLTSTVCMNKDNHRIYSLMTYSPAGGMPLGAFVSSSESQDCIEGGLQLLLSIIDKPFNAKSSPSLFILEDSIPERAAINSVFQSRGQGIMVCPLTVFQTVWHWLHEHRDNNYADIDRASTMRVLKQMLSTLPPRSVERYSRELLTQQRGNMTLFNFIAHLYNRKEEWCLMVKPSTDSTGLKGKATNSAVQAPFKMMKENTFPKMSECDLTQLVDYVVTSWNNGYEQKLVDVANNRYDPHLPKTKAARSNGGITKDGVNQISEYRFHVRSSSDASLYYEVDTQLSLCSCEVGLTGDMCEHLQACFYYYGETITPSVPKISPSQRLLYYKIATGCNALPTDSWFQPLNSGGKSSADNNSQKPQSSAITVSQFHQNQIRRGRKPELSKETKDKLKRRVNKFARQLRSMSESALHHSSISSFLDNVEKVGSDPNQLGDALRMFGTSGGSGLSLNTSIASSSKKTWHRAATHRLTPKSLTRPIKRGRPVEHAYSTKKSKRVEKVYLSLSQAPSSEEQIECIEVIPAASTHDEQHQATDSIIVEDILL